MEKAGYGACHIQRQASSQAHSSYTVSREDPALKAEGNEAAADNFLSLPDSFILPVYGTHDGTSDPLVFSGEENALAFAFTQLLLCLPIALVNRHYFTGGFAALWHRSPNMDSLIGIGSAAALVYGVWAIYQIGLAWALANATWSRVFYGPLLIRRHDINPDYRGKISGKPRQGKNLSSDYQADQPRTKNRRPSDRRRGTGNPAGNGTGRGYSGGKAGAVHPPLTAGWPKGFPPWMNQRLPGEYSCGETGGDPVTGGSISQSGYLKIEATNWAAIPPLLQIIRLLEEASSSKAPISKLADRVSGVFVPIVISIAVLAIIVWLLVGEPFSFAPFHRHLRTGHFLSLPPWASPPLPPPSWWEPEKERKILLQLNPQRHWRWPIPSARWYWTKPALSRRASPMSPILRSMERSSSMESSR